MDGFQKIEMAFSEKVALKWLYTDFGKFLAVFQLFSYKIGHFQEKIKHLWCEKKLEK